MKETIGDVYRRTIAVPGPGIIKGAILRDLVIEMLGEHAHVLHYFREEPCFSMGRRKGYGLGSDLILMCRNLGDPLLWHPERDYGEIIVCDALWNDGFETDPPSESELPPNDITIASLQQFSDALNERLAQVLGAAA